MKKIFLGLLMIISLKGFSQANYQFYKATIGAGFYFKAIPSSASTLDSAVYVDRTTGEFQVRKVPAAGVTDTANKWVNDIRRRPGTDTVEKFKNGTWQFAYKDSIGGGSISGSGTSGRVAYWNGASSITSASNFLFDGNTLTAQSSGASAGVIGISNSGFGVVGESTTGEALSAQILPSSTNSLVTVARMQRFSSGTAANGIGGAIDWFTQSSGGSAQRSNRIGSVWSDATTATRTSTLEFYGVNNTTEGRKAALAGNGRWTWDGYGSGTHSVTPATTPVISSSGVVGERIAPKVYTALLTATAGNAPTATILGTNEIGTIVWTRTTTGRYVGTLSGAFTSNKTWMVVNRGGDASTGFINPWLTWASANTVELSTLDNAGGDVDAFTNLPVRIEVYP